ncbi:UbiA-like polyprenyltransferase [Pelosinus sp. IPA-1]|uniref:UbiA-like polyprenyltransferase n=1 Tax=Pelosinus sp. IPA-1 TaxID=3029569 RepID=UPI0024362B6A|nr:UbiA-like polyprenyltransferase [Pelosinus sp. IPA-1]GMB01871.1 4-hydroxybenzoate octaprenyltransferase [Pelosinus sp. IPA-1]
MSKIKAHLDNIVLSHTVFALPFAYIGAILAAGSIPAARDLFWITLAMVGARSAAMALNNFIDLKYDRLQPRFANRPMVTGAVKPKGAVLMTLASFALFAVAAANLHPLCLKLAPLAVIPLSVYPYMKRFSWTCHLVLGLALSVAPIGAWVAVRGDITLPIVLLGLAVGVWIAGFDAIYGCQDLEFDKKHGLHSMPVRFGIQGTLTISKALHVISITGFVAVGILMNMHGVYYGGVVLAASVLIYQHSIVSPTDFRQVTQAYFMRNGLVSIALLVFTVISIIV